MKEKFVITDGTSGEMITIKNTSDRGLTIEQEAEELGVPVIPKLPDEPYRVGPHDPNPIVAICGECGLHMARVMGYVCSHPRCPCGLGGSSC